MIEKIQHYSLTNQASIFDEEALTALELAGRTAAKVNECVETVNETVEALPGMVDDEVQEHINNGDFDKQVDKYAGELKKQIADSEAAMAQDIETATQEMHAYVSGETNVLKARVENLLGSVQSGSTSMDAEIIDSRTDYRGVTHQTQGTATRQSVKGVAAVAFNKVAGINMTHVNINVDFNPTEHTASLKGDADIIFSEAGAWRYFNGTTLVAELLYPDQTSNLFLSVDTMEFYNIPVGSNPRNPQDFWFCMVSLGADYYPHVIFGPEGFKGNYTINGNAYERPTKGYSQMIGASGCIINIDTTNYKITISGGGCVIFFDMAEYKLITDEVVCDYSHLAGANYSYRLVFDKMNRLLLRDNTKAVYGDRLLAQIHLNNGQVNGIYAPTAVLDCFYVNGVKYRTKPELTNIIGKSTAAIFKKVVCCGDSFTAGMVVPDGYDAIPQNENYAWPYHMGVKTGGKYINAGHSGANSGNWLDCDYGFPRAQASGRSQAYLLGMGLNDRGSAVGTIADIGTDANTYYANMSRIIMALAGLSPDAHIFVMTAPVNDGAIDPYNQAIREIVTAMRDNYNVHCLDLTNYRELYNAVDYDGSYHPSVIGQEMLAEILLYVWSDYINNNPRAFHNVPYIGYD